MEMILCPAPSKHGRYLVLFGEFSQWGGGRYWHPAGRGQGCLLSILPCSGRPPTSKNYLAQNVNYKAEKPWSKSSLTKMFGEVLGFTEHGSGKNLLSEALHILGK